MQFTKRQKRELIRILAAAGLFIAVVLCTALSGIPAWWYLHLPLFLIPYLLVGWDVWRKAMLNLLHGQLLDENFLMCIATVGAIVLGEYPEAVFVMLFYQVGELFQDIAVDKSRRSIAALMEIRPDEARVLRNGVLCTVDPEEVTVGELLVVYPGEKIALDGEVIEGESELNTLSLTGEALPRSIGVGETAISGCINLTSPLHLRVTKPFSESTVSKILELVENSTLAKSKAEHAVTKFAHWYTPSVVALAALLAVIPSLLTGDWQRWLESALIFLVVSCPCALVISIPLAYFGGLGCASRHGILIKGANYLESLANTATVVFDKTGTLTEGRFSVTEICSGDGVSEHRLLRLCAAAEAQSNHPIARSVCAAWQMRNDAPLPEATRITEHAGRGIVAEIEGVQVSVGNEALMRELGADASVAPTFGGSVIHVAADGRYLGYLLVADCIKPTAEAAIRALEAVGVRRTVMLTGDRAENAAETAKALGLSDYRAELLPQDKVTCLEELLCDHTGTLAFVGDGVNDAPVLARADVGIAMGALGSDAAIEAADVVLMDDDPARIADAISIANFTKRKVVQNTVFALGIKGLFLALSLFGLTNMWAATFADVGVAVLAILNSMRTLRYRVG